MGNHVSFIHSFTHYYHSDGVKGMVGSGMGLVKRLVGIVLLVLVVVSPLITAKQLYAQTPITITTAAGVGGGKCPEGYVNAILLIDMSIDRLLTIAYQSNVILDQELVEKTRIIYNLPIEGVVSMDSDSCKKLYSDLADVLKKLAARVGLKLEPVAKGAYERATLRAAQKVLNISLSLNMTDVVKDIEDKMRIGKISIEDLETWDVKVRGKEASIKVQIGVEVAISFAEENTLTPDNESRALKEISKAEEILSRVRDLLVAVNASPNAIKAIDRAIQNIREARSVLENRVSLPKAKKLEDTANSLEDQIKAFNLTLGAVKLPSDTLKKIIDLINEALNKIGEARDAMSRGNLSYAEKLLREAYESFREAKEMFRESVKTSEAPAGSEEELNRLREDLGDLVRKLTNLEREFNLTIALIKTKNQSINEIINRTQESISQAHQLVIDIIGLMEKGRVSEARALVERLKGMIDNIEKNIKTLKRLSKSGKELEEELSKVLAKAADLRNKFEELVGKASNISDQRVQALIDKIRLMFDDLNTTTTNIKRLIDAGSYDEARAAIRKAKQLIDEIEKAIEELEKLLKSLEESGKELEEELSKVLAKAADLRNKFERLVGKASNISDQRVQALIDKIRLLFDDLNTTITNIEGLIDAGSYDEARAAIRKAKQLIDEIEKAIEELEKLLKSLEESGKER